MYCLTRDKPIRLSEKDDDDTLLDEVYAVDEKPLLPFPTRPSEDEMQDRLKELRAQIADAKLDWYVVPSEDEHQSEEVAVSERRREYITNFNGSAGTALVPSASINAKALLFVDSRYWVLAEDAVPKKNWEVRRVGSTGGSGRDSVVGGWAEFIVNELADGTRVGIDPKLISDGVAKSLLSRLSPTSTELIPVKENLVDRTRVPPARSLGPLKTYPVELSGESTKSKITRLRAILTGYARANNWVYLVPTLPTITWLYNYRATADVPFLPVAFAYAALTPTEAVIFVDDRKVTDQALLADWKAAGVTVRPYGVDEVEAFVKQTVSSVPAGDKEAKYRIFASNASSWALIRAAEPNPVNLIACPIDAAKVLKNDVEIQNYRNAYLRDGRAMVRWFAWLDEKLVKEEKKIGEWAAGEVLTRFRRQEEKFAGLAYPNISATGPNAALAHYTPARGNEATIDLETPYVIDAGPQYLDATIDTTRTWFFGKTPSDDIKRAYTRVLQGHIAVATQTFPRNADAGGLGLYSKKFLWEDGLDYGHGLGHGVGNYGEVHEGPVAFARGFSFLPGHVTTIEPGFYLEGQWGMRVESVYLVKEVETKYDFGGLPYLGFEGLTQVPIDTRMIDWSLTTKPEIKWINEYNTSVEKALTPLLEDELDREARDWLKRVCKPKFIFPW
ncbi:hypothetical protein Q8F55_007467 [Vanrija albida]|uniref:Peptidase M24 domain-containing protein n=1 Tax=Vanrija albida TaxID=181172 RepID=A0ABR3PTM5_9TREE